MDEDTKARQMALDQAVRMRDTLVTPELIVKAAKAFYDFLVIKQ